MAALEYNTLEAANIFCGDDPTASSHLVLKNVKFPTMEKAYVDFMPGGGIMGLEIDTHFNKLEVTFSLSGWTPQTMALVGRWSRQTQQFSIYGMLRNRLSGAATRVNAQIFGMLGRVAPDVFEKGTLSMVEYAIKGITRYELEVAGTQLYLFEMATNTMIIGGVNVMDDQNSILNINAATVAGSTEFTSAITQSVGTR